MALRLRRVWQSAAVERGSPSITAQKVALQRLTFDRVPAPYGDPDADIALARDVASGSPVDGESQLSAYLAARTLFFDRVIVRTLDAGLTQAAIIGAGYDGRAFRYAKPGVPLVRGRPSRHADATSAPVSIDSASTAARSAYVAADFANDDVAAVAPRRPDSTPPAATRLHLRRRRRVPRTRGARRVAASDPSGRGTELALRGELLDDA